MANELPYLKEIADNLKIIAGSKNKAEADQLSAISKAIVNASVTQNNISQTNLEGVNETLNTGLVTSVIEGEGSAQHEVPKSIIEIMKEAFVQVFREAMFTVVGEGSQAHEESIFQQIKDTLADIKTAQQTIATALAGSGGSGLSAQVTQIRDALIDTSDPNNPVNRIDNMASIVYGQGSDIAAIKGALIDSSNPSNPVNRIETIKTYTNQINSALYTDTTDSSQSTIRTAGKSLWEIEKTVNNIDQKVQ